MQLIIYFTQLDKIWSHPNVSIILIQRRSKFHFLRQKSLHKLIIRLPRVHDLFYYYCSPENDSTLYFTFMVAILIGATVIVFCGVLAAFRASELSQSEVNITLRCSKF
jgi:hypothetical protein